MHFIVFYYTTSGSTISVLFVFIEINHTVRKTFLYMQENTQDLNCLEF